MSANPKMRAMGWVLSLSVIWLISWQPSIAEELEKFRPVAKATCGPKDHTESVQGQTTLAERFAPGPAKAYHCNLELVGQYEGEGAGAGVAVWDDCAYFSTAPNPHMRHPGVVVLDVSVPRAPARTMYLSSETMRDAHESLEVNKPLQLLVGSRPPGMFDIYDLSADCRRPALISSISLPRVFSHDGQFTLNGRTFYGATWPPYDAKRSYDSAVFALDFQDPKNPKRIALWVPAKEHAGWITHGVAVNRNATRAYVAVKRHTPAQDPNVHPNGLLIFDITEIEARRADAQFRLISALFWNDTTGSEGMVAATIQGRPYLILSDNRGTLSAARPTPYEWCQQGKPIHGYARIIDLSNERRPKTLSRLALEVAHPDDCATVKQDPSDAMYGSFACTVDNEEDGKLLACGHFQAGLRVFDIRDPSHPREVAYYKPPARRTESRPGSLFRPFEGPPRDSTADAVIVAPKFRNNATEIWFTSVDNGFQVVRFSEAFRAAHQELFTNYTN